MTLLEMMTMHQKKFRLVKNLHDLFCLGNKDSKKAL